MRALFAVCSVVALCACPQKLPDVDAGPTFPPSLKHAHNDYEHTRPLLDALDQKFESVEADIWLDGNGNEIGVSHNGAPFKGTLKGLYLDPIADRVAMNGGSVYGDGKTFYLWLDIKDGSTILQDLLVTQLSGYAFLTRFDDTGIAQQGAVTVLLTGDDKAKKALVDRPAPRTYARDSNDYSVNDGPADGKWVSYAVNYFAVMQWDGTDPIPAAQQKQLENLVNGAHAKGRSVRIWSNPDSAPYWKAAKAAHVDFINTDKLADLASSL
ncbi:MAG: hypothetical protein U0228_21325 [Myxococcaceae bacterium]